MTNTKNFDAAIDVVKNNPHTGTTKNIVTLSVDISKSKKSMDKSIFNLYKEKSQINDKIFSKLNSNKIILCFLRVSFAFDDTLSTTIHPNLYLDFTFLRLYPKTKTPLKSLSFDI